MKKKCALSFLLPILGLFPVSLQAQDGGVHPVLADRFVLSVGGFFPDKDFKLSVDGEAPGEDFDLNEAFKVGSSESTGALDFRWRFGEKWSVQGQYWRVRDSGSATLTRDVEWEDVIFREGSFVSANAGLDVARIFFGRQFSSSSTHDFGLGLGFHWLEIKAGIEGQVLTSEGDSQFYQDSVSAEAPLPNIGAWYDYAWSPKWAVTSRLDWFSASIGDYSGSLWNASVGVNWAAFEHFGIIAAYNFFKLDVDVDKSGWHGKVENTQRGPFVGFTAYW